MRNLIDATDAEVKRLLHGRPLIQVVRQHVGRSVGWRVLAIGEFEARLRRAIRDARRDRGAFTQPALADRVGVNTTAFKRYLRDLNVSWQQIKRGEWPAPD